MPEEKVFTPHDVMALQEDILKHIKVMGEQGAQNTKNIAAMQEDLKCLPDMKADIGLLMMDMRDVKTDMQDVKQRLGKIEDKLDGVSKEKVQALDVRVRKLELARA